MTDIRWDEAAKLLDTEPRKAIDLAEQIDREDTPPEGKHDIRRAHQCTRDGCDSPATHRAHLHFRYGRRHVAQEHVRTWVRVCDSSACRKAAWNFILSPANKKGISEQMARIGRLRIDWDNAMIEFVPIGEEAWGPYQMVTLQSGRA